MYLHHHQRTNGKGRDLRGAGLWSEKSRGVRNKALLIFHGISVDSGCYTTSCLFVSSIWGEHEQVVRDDTTNYWSTIEKNARTIHIRIDNLLGPCQESFLPFSKSVRTWTAWPTMVAGILALAYCQEFPWSPLSVQMDVLVAEPATLTSTERLPIVDPYMWYQKPYSQVVWEMEYGWDVMTARSPWVRGKDVSM